MGCNCKVTKDILNLHKKYGYEVKTSWFKTKALSLKEKTENSLIILLLILLSPIILIWFSISMLKGKRVYNINKILKKFIR